jgi:hypothetical protein
MKSLRKGSIMDYSRLESKKREKIELRTKALSELTDPCPYCKFNLKSGEEKCDECGKEFYETIEKI